MRKLLAAIAAFALAFAGLAEAATLTVQNLSIAGLVNGNFSAASTGDGFSNDGNTVLVFYNTGSSARTLTLTVQNSTVNTAGYNPFTIANPTVTLASSGTQGGVSIVGPFGTQEFNDSNGRVNYTLDSSTGMNVSVVKVPRQ